MILCHVLCAYVTIGDISGFISSGCFGPWLTLKLSLHPSSCASLSVSVDIHVNLVRNFKSVAVGATLKTPYEGQIVWEKVEKKHLYVL